MNKLLSFVDLMSHIRKLAAWAKEPEFTFVWLKDDDWEVYEDGVYIKTITTDNIEPYLSGEIETESELDLWPHKKSKDDTL